MTKSSIVKKLPAFRKHFIDTLRVHLRGGAGGAGHPKYGGIGGMGGNVYVEAGDSRTLKQLQSNNPTQRYAASNGAPSQQFCLVGNPGADTVISAPLGTVCTTQGGTTIGEVNELGDRVLLARGGDGGSPTNGFIGQKGQNHSVSLVLKTIADIGLVGFPNAGKSTLLRAISRAKPKIASYPFTTLRPQLGILQYPDYRQITMADLPGLIEGASVNKGLGHKFLRHVERTKILLIVVDVNGFKLGPAHPHRTAMETLILLNKELELYDHTLLDKPAMLVVNKMDTPDAARLYNTFSEQLGTFDATMHNYPEEMRPNAKFQIQEVTGISAKTNPDCISYVKDRLRLLLDLLDGAAAETALVAEGHATDAALFRTKIKEHGVKLI